MDNKLFFKPERRRVQGFKDSRIQGFKCKRQKVRGLEGWRVSKLDKLKKLKKPNKPEKPNRGLDV